MDNRPIKSASTPQIDFDVLLQRVRTLRQSHTLHIKNWHIHPLAYRIVMPMTEGLYRVEGTGLDQGEPIAWSLILKMVRPFTVAEVGEEVVEWCLNPTLFLYWKREPLAYQSGLLDNLPGGLVAPRCLGIDQPTEDSIWMWLEELQDIYGGDWPLSRYGLAGRHLGEFNGAFLRGWPMPTEPWIHEGTLRTILSTFPARYECVLDTVSWKHPLLAETVSVPMVDRLRKLYAEREALLEALDRLPQTFCHLDSSRSNLFACRSYAGQELTGLIDWGTMGRGPYGQDMVQLVWGSLGKWQVSLDPKTLQEIVFEGYIQGLEAAGWRGSVQQVRFGFAATSALQWGLEIPENMLWYATVESRHATVEKRFGVGIKKYLEKQAVLMSHLLDLSEEAHNLVRAI